MEILKGKLIKFAGGDRIGFVSLRHQTRNQALGLVLMGDKQGVHSIRGGETLDLETENAWNIFTKAMVDNVKEIMRGFQKDGKEVKLEDIHIAAETLGEGQPAMGLRDLHEKAVEFGKLYVEAEGDMDMPLMTLLPSPGEGDGMSVSGIFEDDFDKEAFAATAEALGNFHRFTGWNMTMAAWTAIGDDGRRASEREDREEVLYAITTELNGVSLASRILMERDEEGEFTGFGKREDNEVEGEIAGGRMQLHFLWEGHEEYQGSEIRR